MERKKLDVRVTHYANAISYKFDNRRVTVSNNENGGIGLEFRCIDHNYTPHTVNECIHGKIALTYLNLSHEASELLMIGLAERLGYKLIKTE